MQIPGYEWDAERRRYFKVHKTGEQAGSKYSVSAIAEKNRELKRKAEIDTANLTRGENYSALPQTVFEKKRLEKSARNVYSGSADEIISCLHVRTDKQLITGSRNGAFSVGRNKSACDRSIVAVTEWHGHSVFAAVSENFGSVTAWAQGSVQLPNHFINAMSSNEQILAITTNRGIALVDTSGEVSERICGRHTAIVNNSTSTSSYLVGAPYGIVSTFDERCEHLSPAARLSEGGTVTNLAWLRDAHTFVVTSMKDEMLTFDLRNCKSPILKFAEYKNWSTLKHGLAVNEPRVSLVVAQDTGEVAMFDAVTAKHMGNVQYERDNTRQSIVPPSLSWSTDGIFIPNMNAVRQIARKGNRREPAASNAEDLDAIAELLNAEGGKECKYLAMQ